MIGPSIKFFQMRGSAVQSYLTLVIRIVLGVVFAVILWRLFYPERSPIFAVVLLIVLVSLSYFTAYLRRRKK